MMATRQASVMLDLIGRKEHSMTAKHSPVASPSSAMSSSSMASSKTPEIEIAITNAPVAEKSAIGMKQSETEAAIAKVSLSTADPDSLNVSRAKICTLDIPSATFPMQLPLDMSLPLRAVARPAQMCDLKDDIQGIATGVTSIATSMVKVANSVRDTLALLGRNVEAQKALAQEQLVVKEMVGKLSDALTPSVEAAVEKAISGLKAEILGEIMQYIKSMPKPVQVRLVEELIDEGIGADFDEEDPVAQIIFPQGNGYWNFAKDEFDVLAAGKVIKNKNAACVGEEGATKDVAQIVKGIVQAGRGPRGGGGGGGWCAVM